MWNIFLSIFIVFVFPVVGVSSVVEKYMKQTAGITAAGSLAGVGAFAAYRWYLGREEARAQDRGDLKEAAQFRAKKKKMSRWAGGAAAVAATGGLVYTGLHVQKRRKQAKVGDPEDKRETLDLAGSEGDGDLESLFVDEGSGSIAGAGADSTEGDRGVSAAIRESEIPVTGDKRETLALAGSVGDGDLESLEGESKEGESTPVRGDGESVGKEITSREDLSEGGAAGAGSGILLTELSSPADFTWLALPAITSFALDDLSSQAQQYGNKMMNLCRLAGMREEWTAVRRKTGYAVDVPAYVGISSDAVLHFLKVQSLFPKEKVDEAQMEQALNSAWRGWSMPEGSTAESLFGEDGKKLDEFLSSHTGSKLMVRSTGEEDSAELSNAGGNASKANVTPTLVAIVDAMREVVCSYLGEKSRGQKHAAAVGAGTSAGAVRDIFLPVLVQVMVGEIDDGIIPVSGVMFTQDPESGRADSTANETSGITVINAAYGHNELVVNSLGAVDTVYVGSDGYPYSIVAHKSRRLRPLSGGRLEWVANQERRRAPSGPSGELKPALLAELPALSRDDIKALKYIARIVEKSYNRAMDIEFVIKGKTIYVVQARPFENPNDEDQDPSYIDLNNVMCRAAEKVYGETVVAAGGQVRWCDGSSASYIGTRTAGEALNAYIRLNDDQQSRIQAIIVQELAAANSHEATQFRRFCKPLLCMQTGYHKALTVLQRGCVIDPQQQLLIGLDSVGPVLKKGRITYPAPQKLSVPDVDITEEQFDQVCTQTNSLLGGRIRGESKEKEPFKVMRLALQALRESRGYEENLNALNIIWDICSGHPIFKRYQNRYRNCVVAASKLITMLSKSIRHTESERMTKWLYPLHFLETVIFQQGGDSECLNADSFIRLASGGAEEFKSKSVLSIKEEPCDETMVALNMLGKSAFREDVRAAFSHFVKSNFATTELRNEGARAEFGRHLRLLSSLDLLPVWLNTSFAKQVREGHVLSLGSLNREIAASREALEELRRIKEEIKAVELSLFSAPKTFVKVWQHFKETFLSYFTALEFKDNFGNAEGLVKIAYLETMRLLVDTFDSAIKQVTGSTLFKVNSERQLVGEGTLTLLQMYGDPRVCSQQIENGDLLFTFCVMLNSYRELVFAWWGNLKAWGIIINPYNESNRRGGGTPFFNAREVLDNTFEEKKLDIDNPGQLYGDDFNVSAVSLGSGCSVMDCFGSIDTLEKIFIWCHQSLLNIVAQLNAKYGISLDLLPLSFQALVGALLNPDRGGRTVVPHALLGGIAYEGSVLNAWVNQPCNNHAATTHLACNISSNQVSITTHYYGHNSNNRILRAEFFAWHAYYEDVGSLFRENAPFFSTHVFSSSLSCSWKSSLSEAIAIAPSIAKSIFQGVMYLSYFSSFNMEWSSPCRSNGTNKVHLISDSQLDTLLACASRGLFLNGFLEVARYKCGHSSYTDKQRFLTPLLRYKALVEVSPAGSGLREMCVMSQEERLGLVQRLIEVLTPAVSTSV